MEQNHTTSAAATPQPEVPLQDQLLETLLALRPPAGAPLEQIDQACRDQAQAIYHLLMEQGHVLMGAPPAAQILRDAKSFAERLTLSNLALRILNMLAWSNVQTPETKPARKWIDDYLEGKGHGPVGQAMLWPAQLPGICHLLREWGFQPTVAVPGQPVFVARALPNPTVQ